MIRQNKIYIGLAGFTGFLLILLLAFHFLDPAFVNSKWTRDKVQTIIFQKTGGKAEYKTAELSLIPYIHAKIHQATFSIPGKGKGTIETLHIIPKLLPIFTGRFLIEEIKIESPNIEMVITKHLENSNEANKPFRIDSIKDTVANILSPLATELPEFNATMTNGKFNLVEEDDTVLLFSDVRSEINCISQEIGIKMECTSNICDDISVNASFDNQELKGEGKVELKQFQPQTLINRFLPNAAYRIKSPINRINVSLKTDGPKDFQVDIDKINISANYDGIPFPLQINDGKINYDGEHINLKNVEGTFGRSSFSGLTSRISLGKIANIEIQSGKIMALLKELYPWISSFDKEDKVLKDLKTVSGTLQVSSLKLKGPLTIPKSWSIEATGKVENIIVETTLFPEPIEMKEGNLKVVEKSLLLSDAQVNASDISISLSATISHIVSAPVKVDIGFHGEAGKDSIEFIEDLAKLPPELRIRPPLSILKAHLSLEKKSGISFVSNLTLQDGPGFSLDMFMNSEGLGINNFLIHDDASNASFMLYLKDEVIDVGFAGNLSHTTTDKIFINTPLSKELIKGDFQAHIILDKLQHSTFQGTLEGKDLSFPGIQNMPLNINDISLHADNKNIRLDPLSITWHDNHLSADGDVNISENGLLFDLDISSDGLNWDTIRKSLNNVDKEQGKDSDEEKRFWNVPVNGVLRLNAESFSYNQYTLKPVQAEISFAPDRIDVQVIDANICGISCPGVLNVTPQDISLDFQLLSHDQKLGTMINCFGGKNGFVTGILNLEAKVMAKGKNEELVKSLNGNFEGITKNGKVNRLGLLSKILSFINITEAFRGKLPNLTKKGFPYNSITANGEIQNNILMLNEFVLDAPSMGVTSHGTIDLTNETLDLKVLVSPFKTVDFVIKKTPIINGLLGGTLISIPVRVQGDIENPKISHLSPSDVGKKLLNTTKRVLKTPVRIFKPVLPGKKKNDRNVVE